MPTTSFATRNSFSSSINITSLDRWLSLLTGTALAVKGLRQKSGGTFPVLVGAELIRRGFTGHCYARELFGGSQESSHGASQVSVPYESGEHIRARTTIRVPREEAFSFWRQLENLPHAFEHLRSVKRISDQRSHWTMEGPAGSTFDWDAVVNNEIENELIGWRSLPGSQVDIAGSVHFTDVADGTEIFVHLKYHPPAGELGITLVKLLGRDPHEEIKVGLERLKEFLESSNAPVPVTQAETEQKMG